MAECRQKCVKTICCQSDAIFPDPYNFHFEGGQQSPDSHLFQSNFVKTAKYSAITFLPKALILQFKRIANVYFLIIAILQSIPEISPLDPLTAWTPLVVVIAISMIREGYEDYQRYLSDKQTNYQTLTEIVRDGKFVQTNWSEVKVGDIVRTKAEDMFPADLILLTSSADGTAFIETASLDGQKNLKPRNALKQTIQYNTLQKLRKLEGQFEGIPPDPQLHKFTSKINLKTGDQMLINGDKQLMYRGTRLKNTKWIFGLAIYTGRNSKIIMNSKSSSSKMSQVERKVNKVLLFIFLTQIILCLICGILFGVFRNQNEQSSQYILWRDYPVPLDSFLVFLGYFVLLNTMIPISLIVSIEIVKMAQKIFITKDKLMFSEYRRKNVEVKSSSLNEQLGQIQYVFSDKTGTLTMNIMEFKIAIIGTQMFGDLSIFSRGAVSIKGSKEFKDQRLKKLLANGVGNKNANPSIIVKDREGETMISLNTIKDLSSQYMKALSMAHQVVADTDKKGEKVYQGPSPDEITLVDAAREMDYQFMRNTQSTTTVKILGEEQTFQLLNVFPFTSDRKRMSVVIRDNGIIKMYTKGADSIVKKRLARDQKLYLDNQLLQFSVKGLRTLLVAVRIISEQQYSQFERKMLELPPTKNQQQKQLIISELETNLYLIGATAVLDRLQDQVPQTIRDLLRANIKVWMLTGDKMETAQNIAKSCNLIEPHFEVMKYQPAPNLTDQEVLFLLRNLVSDAQRNTEEGIKKALLIEGGDLTPILKNESTQRELANLAKQCESVICCRLLPSQKADVVRIVRKYLNKITLAIGDGSNDVPMIKQAHIGVGLFGEEGMGAVQASDYALPEFRMLWRLLLVHGRWNYIRISEMILYFFYKNMLFTLPQFLAAFFCGYSSQTIFDDWYVSFYNLAFTSIPLLIRAIFQQDVNYIYKKKQVEVEVQNPGSLKSLIKQESYLPHEYKTNKYFYRLFPKIYFVGQENCIFNLQNYFFWMIQAILESVMITIFTFYIIGQVSVNEGGYNSDFWLVSLTLFSSVILVVTFKLATHTRFWSILLFLSIIITSLGFYILHMWISNYAHFQMTEYVAGTTYMAMTSGETYLVVLFSVCVVLFVDGIVVFMDFKRGGFASQMRKVIKEEKINNKRFYDELSLTITDNLTKMEENNL